jgi:excisionase family DNA binding protein
MTVAKRTRKSEPTPAPDPLVPAASVPDLADKPTYRVSEVAMHFDVTERTVYLWIAHGHLRTEQTPGGQTRVTRDSLDSCRFGPKTAKVTPFSA